jgi:hypothetical protein
MENSEITSTNKRKTMSEDVKKTAKISPAVEKAFRSAKVGDGLAFLSFKENGGIYKVIHREGIRGNYGTIILSLERTVQDQVEHLELDMRRDGPNIAIMGILREHKPRGRKPSIIPPPSPSANDANNKKESII